MPYVITAPCIADYSCLQVCPVNCISPGPEDGKFMDTEQLYIDPNVCINCAACVDACPVSAIYEKDQLPSKWEHYAQVNADFFAAQREKETVGVDA